MGLNFVRGGPLKFKNEKKKTEPYEPQPSNSHKDLRDVIEDEKHREFDHERPRGKPRGDHRGGYDKHDDQRPPYKKRGGFNDEQREYQPRKVTDGEAGEARRGGYNKPREGGPR